MKQTTNIKYSYCLDEDGEIVHIQELNKENRLRSRFFCISCAQEMVAKIGNGDRVKHFAHKSDCSCNSESYLHKLAKLLIRKKFMSSDSFPITFSSFNRDITCCESSTCPLYETYSCRKEEEEYIKRDLKFYNGRVVYDTCKEEVTVGDFRPDLLLACSTKSEREPVFIEVFKTHESDERKMSSKYKIIETRKIESEKDIQHIIKWGFIENENCIMRNFHPKVPSIKLNNRHIIRFSLFKNWAAKVDEIINEQYVLTCADANIKIYRESIRELNLKEKFITVDEEKEIRPNPFQQGLVYLVKKGLPIRNCIICEYYRHNEFRLSSLCILYKHLQLPNSKPRQSTANECSKFRLNQSLMEIPLSVLEENILEVPFEKQ